MPPALISGASIVLNLDSTFGPISSINAFSATGDQIGFSNYSATTAYLTSSSAASASCPIFPSSL
jgi:hypothetical protein